MGLAGGRAGAGPRARVAPGLSAGGRLARRRARRDGRTRCSATVGRPSGASAAFARARRLGRRGGRALRSQPVRQLRIRRRPRGSGRPSARRPRRRPAPGRVGCRWDRYRPRARGGYPPVTVDGISRAAHRAGSRPRTRAAARGRGRRLRGRGTPLDSISRPGSPCRHDADGHAARCRARSGGSCPGDRGDRARAWRHRDHRPARALAGCRNDRPRAVPR